MKRIVTTGRDGARIAYAVPGTLPAADIPAGCLCHWLKRDGETHWSITRLMRDCPAHGWVMAPVGALAPLLSRAGLAWNTPPKLIEPLTRLRASLRWNPDSPQVPAATADVCALLIWLNDTWSPYVLFEPLRVLNRLVDLRANPFTPTEERDLMEGMGG